MENEFYCLSCSKWKKLSCKIERHGLNDICTRCAKGIEAHKITPGGDKQKRKRRANSPKEDFDMSVIYMSVREIAQAIGKTESTVINGINEGKLKALSHSGRCFIHPEDAKAYIEDKLFFNRIKLK